MTKPCFSIVGAGLGGLTAAITLQRVGYECQVYEQAPAIGRVGAGINIAPNSTRLFASVGLDAELRQVGIEPRSKCSRHWQTGEVIFTIPVKELTELYGGPFLAFHRADLHAVLASALKPGTVIIGKKLERLETGPLTNRLFFDDGTVVESDAVIGADGAHSCVREAIAPGNNPTYHGLTAYRAIVPMDKIGVPVEDNTKWWAPDRYVMVYYLSERRDSVHFVASVPEPQPDSPATTDGSIDTLRQALEGFHADVLALIDAAPGVTRSPLIEGREFTPWSKGSVVLLGDACHATTPHMGQGAGMAFEDAFILARCVVEHEDDLPRAFEKYELNRAKRTAQIQYVSHQNQWTKTSMDHKWVYGYDALTVPLEDPSVEPVSSGIGSAAS